MPGSLEDLIAENQATYSQELMVARSQPPDVQATADFKGDPDNLAKLAELAEVDPDDIAAVAIRGTNVSFMVKDAQGAVSAGFFPIAAFADDEDRAAAAAERGGVKPTVQIDPPLHGGTATVPTVATEPGAATDAGTPENIDNLTGAQVATLLKDTPDGVDRDAVLAHEFDREGGPRVSVQRAASTLGLLDDEGQPKTADPPVENT